jgi:hypothetical protein
VVLVEIGVGRDLVLQDELLDLRHVYRDLGHALQNLITILNEITEAKL